MFHNSNLFGSCIIHILYTECAKIKKYNSGAKRLILTHLVSFSILLRIQFNVIDTYNPDVVIGTESWLSEEINNSEVFRDDCITFRMDRCFLEVVKFSFVLKITPIAGSYGLIRILRC